MASLPPLTRSSLFKDAVPVMLSQAAIASTGVVDTTVMGLYGDKVDIGAVGIAVIVVNFVYWAFGFLRMSTTGLVAQAVGERNDSEVRAVLQRALLTGIGLGVLILLLAGVLRSVVFAPFAAEADVIELAKDYWDARVWGAPASLMLFGISGWLLGTGRTGQLLLLQIVMNGVNVVLDIWFVAGLNMGPAGIAAGTAIAEWSALGLGLVLVAKSLRAAPGLFDRAKLLALFSANRDVLIRTLALTFGFAWFVNSGSSLGTAILAGNEILMQFITVSAFVLDGFAFIAEKEVGEAYGRRDKSRMIRSMRVTTELAFAFGVVISVLYYVGGGVLIHTIIRDDAARDVALTYLPYCAAAPVIGVLCFQFDGFFLGATQGKALRNASVISMALYVGTDFVLKGALSNHGVWAALLLFYVYRAACLGWYLPELIRKTGFENEPNQRT